MNSKKQNTNKITLILQIINILLISFSLYLAFTLYSDYNSGLTPQEKYTISEQKKEDKIKQKQIDKIKSLSDSEKVKFYYNDPLLYIKLIGSNRDLIPNTDISNSLNKDEGQNIYKGIKEFYGKNTNYTVINEDYFNLYNIAARESGLNKTQSYDDFSGLYAVKGEASPSTVEQTKHVLEKIKSGQFSYKRSWF